MPNQMKLNMNDHWVVPAIFAKLVSIGSISRSRYQLCIIIIIIGACAQKLQLYITFLKCLPFLFYDNYVCIQLQNFGF